jgi:HK97 family phage major capsid protein
MSEAVQDKFQTRDEIVSFVEQQAIAAVEKAVQASSKVERRVPWVTSGPVGRDSDGYSVLKAAAFALGYIGADEAKEELHVHHQLCEVYKTFGFVPRCGAQTFLVPIATNHLPAYDAKGTRMRDEIRQKMTAHADRFDLDEANWINRKLGIRTKALGTLSDLAGGSLVPLPMLGEMIDLQRNMEAFASAGAQEIALPPNGRLQFPKLTGGSTAYWVGEGTSITDNDPSTGSLDLQAKKLGIFVKVNNELLRFASPSAEGLLRFDMARTAALKADLAMLEGTGGTQIKGLLTYSGITSHTASTVGSNGNQFEAQDVALMESKLPDAVASPTAWLMRRTMFAALMNRRADAVDAADGAGSFLFNSSRNASDAPPAELYGTKVVRSSQISNTRVKGSGTNLSYILLGYFPDWIVARLGVMEFLASGLGDTALQNDQTYLRGIQHVDAGPRNAASFVLCDQLIVG